MKIILDTNVVVSALLSPTGAPARILALVLKGTITMAYNNSILAEYMDVLNRRKLKINKELIGPIVDFINKEGKYMTADPQKIKLPDEDDRVFYELYKSGEIDYLVTGNIRHFPRENGIVTPKTFLEKEYHSQH